MSAKKSCRPRRARPECLGVSSPARIGSEQRPILLTTFSQYSETSMTDKLSRRSILSRAAAGTAAAVLPVGVPALSGAEPDPIFAAIERHRETMRGYARVTIATDQVLYEQTLAAGKPWSWPFIPGTPESEEWHDGLSEDLEDAQWDVLVTKPATIAGIAALLDHLSLPSFPE